MPDRTGFRFRNRLFWKIGIVYLLLFLLVMSVLDIYFVRAVKREYSEAAFSQLEYISALALNNPPSASSRPVLAEWSGRLSKGGGPVDSADDERGGLGRFRGESERHGEP